MMKEIIGHVIIIGSTVLILTVTYLLLKMLIKRLPVWVGKIAASDKVLRTKYAIVVSGIWVCTASVILGIDITSNYDAWFFRLMGLLLLWCTPVIFYWLCIWLWGRVPLPRCKAPRIPQLSKRIMRRLKWIPHLIAGMCALSVLRVFTFSMENPPSGLLFLFLSVVTFFAVFIISFLLFLYVKKHIFRAVLVISYIAVMGNADHAVQQAKRESLNWTTMTRTQREACIDYAFIKTAQEIFQSLSLEERKSVESEYQQVMNITTSQKASERWKAFSGYTRKKCTDAGYEKLMANALAGASPEELRRVIAEQKREREENPYADAAKRLTQKSDDEAHSKYPGLLKYE